MKLICTITGAEVTASAEAAVRLIESGSFRAVEAAPAPKPRRAAPKKKQQSVKGA